MVLHFSYCDIFDDVVYSFLIVLFVFNVFTLYLLIVVWQHVLLPCQFIVAVVFVFMVLSCDCFGMQYSCHVDVVIMLNLIVLFTFQLWIVVLWSAFSFKFVDHCVMVFAAAVPCCICFPVCALTVLIIL